MTPKEIVCAMLGGDSPERLLDQYEPFALMFGDPVRNYIFQGLEEGCDIRDPWGTRWVWPRGEPGSTAFVTEADKVITDITQWEKQIHIPDLKKHCSSGWEAVARRAARVDRSSRMVTGFMACGIFEQCHFLMGFEDTLCNLLLEPAAMHALIDAILATRMQFAELLIENLHPDAILSHDDWGAKNSLFMQPDTWREFFKEPYRKLYGYLHEHGVVVIHHSDSYCEPIVEDMVDCGIDIWQGVLPQNNIPEIQRAVRGNLVLMGGLDAAVIDRSDSTEEEIRGEVRRACAQYAPGGGFIPCMTYGAPGAIQPRVDALISDEIHRFNSRVNQPVIV